jgi:hypothetical protein
VVQSPSLYAPFSTFAGLSNSIHQDIFLLYTYPTKLFLGLGSGGGGGKKEFRWGTPTLNGLGNTLGPTREIMLMVEFSQKLVISYRVSNFMGEKGNFESTLLIKYHSTYG